MTEGLELFLRDTLCIDLEIDRDSRRIERVGALRSDDGNTKSLERIGTSRKPLSMPSLTAELDRFSAGCARLLGHNLLHHDLPVLRAEVPGLRLLQLPVVDTLYLSALAFPEKPYHRLVKDYRLVHESVNDPVADAELAGRVFCDAWSALMEKGRETPGLLPFYAACFDDDLGDHGGLAHALREIEACSQVPAPMDPAQTLLDLLDGSACRSMVEQLADEMRSSVPAAMAYVVAWLRVAGEDSVLPPWVRLRFPLVPELLDRLRRARSTGEPCPAGESCAYCCSRTTPDAELERYFGFPGFRAEPKTDDGLSLQRQIAVYGMSARSQLAVLATGAGKSVCYQLPALIHYRRRGKLTLVISPLQALMKDQVENLNRRIGVERAAALNGLLTPPERGRVLERIRIGEIALLYVAPEQLRNLSFHKTIATREIASWIYDEAHCLSKWGHDFRPDYLFAARFIRKLAADQGTELPAVSCFTATAKKDVVAEIREHFKRELELDLVLSTSHVGRDELRFFVETISPQRKLPRIVELLQERFSPPENAGSAVVYFAARKSTEEAARYLLEQGLDAQAFHAGLSPPRKREVLDSFTQGRLKIVCATNAFGMGIDKEDVRVVIHGDVPGSLEAYLQEAGRAGRDRLPSDCILLFDEADVERQFKLSAASRLEKYDLEQLLRAVRRAIRKRPDGRVALTSGELLRDEELDIDIRPDDWLADTQVRTALAWLERAGFLERGHNRTWVFQGRLKVQSLDQARSRLQALSLPAADKRRWLSIIKALIQAESDRGLTVDDLAQRWEIAGPEAAGSGDPQKAGKQVIRDLQAMAKTGLIHEGLQLSAYLRPKGKGKSTSSLQDVVKLERAMIDALREQDPDAELGELVTLSLRRLNQRLLDQGESSNTESLRALLKSLAEDGRGLAGSHGSLDLRYRRRGQYSIKLRRSWEQLAELADRRRQASKVVLDALLAKVADRASGQVLVAFSLDDMVSALERDLVLRQTLRDPLAAAERALLFLHEHRAVQLQNGLAVFRQAMTLELQPEKKGRRYTHGDYQPLAEHYEERTFQVHVMARYAQEALVRLRRGLELVHDYFEHGHDAFRAKWFHDQEEDVQRATGRQSYRRIVEDLGNPEQQAIVTAPLDRNLLVLAGPGSGKTRVVVHRCAYLLRVERVPARSILVVCFNRAASLELRRRLRDLVGDDAVGVTVCTYHALALRITGRSLGDGNDTEALAQLIPDAVKLLESEDIDTVPGMESDELRERLLAGFRHILVDEYQDIDEPQYRLISAIVGQSRKESQQSLSILAVGDDDQTIYGFTGANVRFIRQFQHDYGGDEESTHHLVQCYRSSGHIVDAANYLIARNQDRMKVDRPIRIDHDRRHAPPGEPVRLFRVRSVQHQAAVVVDRIEALRSEAGNGPVGRVAVLARRHAVLEPVFALLRHRRPDESPVWLGRHPLPPLTRIREIRHTLEWLHEHRHRELTSADIPVLVDEKNPWLRLLRDVLTEWSEECRDQPCPGSAILEFLYEALAEQRREPSRGDGPVLSTIHAAKGLEFDHVFVIDGGWSRPGATAEQEEERRLFYVGMTRAKRTLHLFTGIDGPNPHTDLFRGKYPFLCRSESTSAEPDRAIWGRRRQLIGLEDIFLSWAGRQGPGVQQRIAAVRTGDPVQLRPSGRHLFVVDQNGGRIAKLSRLGSERWRPLLRELESSRVLAWVERRIDDSEPAHRAELATDRWQAPILEVTLGAR